MERDLRSRQWAWRHETWVMPGALLSLPHFRKRRTGSWTPIRWSLRSRDLLVDESPPSGGLGGLSEWQESGSRYGGKGLQQCACAKSFHFMLIWIFQRFIFFSCFLTGSLAYVVIFNIHLFTVNTNEDTVQLIFSANQNI